MLNKKLFLYQTLLAILISVLAVGSLALAAFDEPGDGCTPPACNADAPINVGDEEQTKTGDLIVSNASNNSTLTSDTLNVRGPALINSESLSATTALIVKSGNVLIGTEANPGSPNPYNFVLQKEQNLSTTIFVSNPCTGYGSCTSALSSIELSVGNQRRGTFVTTSDDFLDVPGLGALHERYARRTAFFSDNNNGLIFLANSGGDIRFDTGTNIWDPDEETKRLRINSVGIMVTGKVGINKDIPTKELEVTGEILASGDICTSAGNCLNSVGGSNIWTRSSSGSPRTVKLADDTDVVGIGVTPSLAKLFVMGTYGARPIDGVMYSKIAHFAATGDGDYVELSTNLNNSMAILGGSNDSLMFATQTGASDHTERMRIANNGNIGIGTASPNAKLHIYSVSGNPAELDLQSVAGAGNHWGISQNILGTNALDFWHNGNIRLSIIETGVANKDTRIYASATNAGIILEPNGTGAFQLSSGGNARGTNAVDLQIDRGTSEPDVRIASGISSFIGGGVENKASGYTSVVVGGRNNKADAASGYAFIGGGMDNQASGHKSVVVGGLGNKTLASAERSFIGGGESNSASGVGFSVVVGGFTNTASGEKSFVGGGEYNVATLFTSVVVGGSGNTSSGEESFVGGGLQNSASGSMSSVIGGWLNTASGSKSFAAGGKSNEASGGYSFAAGTQAKATHAGSFVWADSLAADYFSNGVDTFNVRARGGTYFYTPFIKLTPQSPASPPPSCAASNAGAIAMTSGYRICVCNGTSWIFDYNGASCSW